MNAILKAAFSYEGTSIIDIVSPCVTFNNHDSSTKSYKNVKDHEMPLHELGFVAFNELENIEIAAGESKTVDFPDGSKVTFRNIHENYDPTDAVGAIKLVKESLSKNELLTGLLYIRPGSPDFNKVLNLVDEPLASLDLKALKPSPQILSEIMESLA
jgi:2-oxoglutarate ferredoxin oxidoreductase subunit beta